MKITSTCIRVILFIVIIANANAQSYHAMNGSAYAGVLSNFVNPASPINSPFKWDISVLGAQSTTSNSAVSITNLTLANLTPDNINNIIVQPTDGNGSRSIDNAADFDLLNVRFNIDNIQCISYGFRVRTYTHASTSSFKYIDTTSGFFPFLSYNASSSPFNASGYNEAWVENDFSYARILSDNDGNRLSAGITLEVLRGISGVYGALNNVSYQSEPNRNVITNGGVTTLYSSTYSALNDKDRVFKNLMDFKNAGKFSLGTSVGVEYVVKKNVFDEPYNPKNYYLKIGASIMDLGNNNFNTAQYSFNVNVPKGGLTDTGIDNQIHRSKGQDNVKRVLINDFQDTTQMQQTFKMSLPTRFVLTIDKSISDYFFINAMLNINFYSQNVTDIYKIKTGELNRLIITPRLENDVWGIYVPIQYTMKHDIMVGAALKLGPLLIGLHNINWLQRTKIEGLDGGGYMALHFQPRLKKLHHSLDCYSGDL